MSTTLAVLHVFMSGGRDDSSSSLLMTSPTPASLMTSRPASSSLLASLDPALVDFWSGFPCPPPWNEALLFKVNWTACVSQTVGERIRWFLADRCHIPYNGTIPLPDSGGGGGGDGGGGGGGGFGDYGEEEGGEVCDMACKILVGLFCVLFVVGVVIGGVCLLHRRRSQKRKDPRRGPQQTTGSGSDRGRAQYAGIHYASASVITREGERPLPPCPEGEDGAAHPLPRQLHSYVYNPRNNDHDHGPGPRGQDPQTFHLHLCPLSRRAAAYRAMEPRTAQENGEEPPHHYDYISDTDSVRYRGGSVNDYTYCTCDHSEGGSSSVAAECNSATTTPRQSEGYYSDHDLAVKQQHEISKPYPRYPEKSVGGSKPVVGEGGLNNNHPEANATVFHGFRDGVFVDSDPHRRGQGYPPGHGYPQLPVDCRHPSVVPGYPSRQTSIPAERAPSLPRNHVRHYPAVPPANPGAFLVDPSAAQHTLPRRHGHQPLPVDQHLRQPYPGGFSGDRAHLPAHTVNSYEDPVDGIRNNGFPADRTHIPLQSMNSYEVPVNAIVEEESEENRANPHRRDDVSREGSSSTDRRRTGGTLRFVNAPTEDWDSSAASGSTGSTLPVSHRGGEQHPHEPAELAAARVSAVAVHPRYFPEGSDANTSSV